MPIEPVEEICALCKSETGRIKGEIDAMYLFPIGNRQKQIGPVCDTCYEEKVDSGDFVGFYGDPAEEVW